MKKWRRKFWRKMHVVEWNLSLTIQCGYFEGPKHIPVWAILAIRAVSYLLQAEPSWLEDTEIPF